MLSPNHEILRPIPRRTFDLNPASAESSSPTTPYPDSTNPNIVDLNPQTDFPPSRNRSILNLTSSTLFGIYQPSDYDASRDESSTPLGTGVQTPSGRQSLDTTASPAIADWERPRLKRIKSASQRRNRTSDSFLPFLLRTVLLFVFGVSYGVIITHLHDNHNLAPVRVHGINRYSRVYLGFWGFAGAGLGSLLPWVDRLSDDKLGHAPEGSGIRRPAKGNSIVRDSDDEEDTASSKNSSNGLGADWTPVVRSIGAFVGIAFAIRRLPWQSHLQLSLTLALANPFLWYLLNRSKPGFFLSSFISLSGTFILLRVNPEMVPSPATSSMPANVLNASRGDGGGIPGAPWLNFGGLGVVSAETISVGTWIASVLFCSCVCFGNIGRRLGKGSLGG